MLRHNYTTPKQVIVLIVLIDTGLCNAIAYDVYIAIKMSTNHITAFGYIDEHKISRANNNNASRVQIKSAF